MIETRQKILRLEQNYSLIFNEKIDYYNLGYFKIVSLDTLIYF